MKHAVDDGADSASVHPRDLGFELVERLRQPSGAPFSIWSACAAPTAE